jgi:hypothetical protein
MQISSLVTLPVQPLDSMLSGHDPQAAAAPARDQQSADTQLTPLAALAYAHSLTDVRCTSDSSSYSCRAADNSLLMQATQHTDLHLRSEQVSLALTFSAESLGLTAADFSSANQAGFQLRFSLQSRQLQATRTLQQQMVTPTRTAADVLTDLSKALVDIFKNRGDKSISVILDPEAIQSILGDEKISRLFAELLSIIGTLNRMKLEAGPKDKYLIHLSGKGQPYLDRRETTTLDDRETSLDIQITILPPAAPAVPAEADQRSK